MTSLITSRGGVESTKCMRPVLLLWVSFPTVFRARRDTVSLVRALDEASS